MANNGDGCDSARAVTMADRNHYCKQRKPNTRKKKDGDGGRGEMRRKFGALSLAGCQTSSRAKSSKVKSDLSGLVWSGLVPCLAQVESCGLMDRESGRACLALEGWAGLGWPGLGFRDQRRLLDLDVQ